MGTTLYSIQALDLSYPLEPIPNITMNILIYSQFSNFEVIYRQSLRKVKKHNHSLVRKQGLELVKNVVSSKHFSPESNGRACRLHSLSRV